MNRAGKATTIVAISVGALLLVSCSPKPIDTDDSGSIALVEEFFAHLEAGEATEAAALTNMDFDDEFIDDDFYQASAALPSDARIVETSGYDSAAFKATVSYVTDNPDTPVTIDVHVGLDGDRLVISGWSDDSPIRTTPVPFPATVIVNGMLEFELTETNTLTLLPAAYRGEYSEPSGLTELISQSSDFVANVPAEPDGPRLNATPSLLPDVDDGVLNAIEGLQAACAEEGFVGASCPDELVAAVDTALDPSVTAEWYREPESEIVYSDGEFRAANEYKVSLSAWESSVALPVTYSGVVSRDSAGDIVLTMPE